MTATGQSICIIKEITWPIPSKYSFGAEKIMLSMYGVISMSISIRSCIHKRLSKVWKWEILTIASAEEREIS